MSSRFRRLAHKRGLTGVALGAGALSLMLTPIAAGAAAPYKKLTPLQQGLNFYKGKVITLVSPDAVGGGFDLTARAIAPSLASFFGATVNVTNDAPANTIAGQDYFEAQAPDGLTIGMINAGADIENIVTGVTGVNFNPQKLQFLGGNNASGGGFSCLASSGITSFGQVVHSTSPITETVVSTGSQTLQTDLINASFGVNAKIIGGYASTSAEVQGFERGDGACGPLSISTGSFGPFLQAGKANQLLKLSSSNPATAFYQYQANAMPIQTAFKQFPATTKAEKAARIALLEVGSGVGHEWNVQPRVASYKVAALRAAVKSALTNITVEDRLLSEGQQNGYVTGPRALQGTRTSSQR